MFRILRLAVRYTFNMLRRQAIFMFVTRKVIVIIYTGGTSKMNMNGCQKYY